MILVGTSIAWFAHHETAGYIGATIWLWLLFLPSLAMRRITELILDERLRAAAWWANVTAIFHPTAQLRLLRHALSFVRVGDEDAARRELAALRDPTHLCRALELILATRASRKLAGSLPQELRVSALPPVRRSLRPVTRMVAIIMAANIAMFLLELAMGGSTNPRTLHRLGELELSAVRYNGEYWRLITALFLHYGSLHLVFNLYALFVIGPGLERAIGALRFGVFYLLSGLGSSLGVLFWRTLGLTRAEQLVGASGCVMGLVGVWAGLLLRDRHAPLAGRRLRNILLIVAIQTAFDLSTPQISMAAHLSGLVSGLALGLGLAPRRLST